MQGELNSIGIKTFEQMQELGWEEICERWVQFYPERANLNAFAAIIGALQDRDWRKITPDSKVQAKRLLRQLKS